MSDDAPDERPDPFRAAVPPPLRRRVVPVVESLRGYDRDSARRDLTAGITGAALAIPAGMAFAELAGVSPVAGLYALLLPLLAYAVLGSSRQLVVGPGGAIALLTATAVAPIAADSDAGYVELTAMLAILVAGVCLAARVVRLGWIADYLSRAVLVGYLHGVAFVLVVGQLAKLLGLSIGSAGTPDQLVEIVEEFGDVHGLTVLIGLTTLAVLLVLRYRWPKIPGPLVAVVGGIAVSSIFGLADEGVAVVANIPSGLPSLGVPDVGFGDTLRLLPAGLGIFAVAYADGILTARAFAGRHRQHIDANQELVALGATNLVSGVSGAFPVGASNSRTAVNDELGGRTQLVGVVGAAVIALVLLFLTEPFEKLPTACLGAVIIAAAIGLVDPSAWRALAAVGRGQVAIAAVTTVGVIAIGVLEALLLAVALSIIDVVTRSAKPHDAVLGWVERMGRYANVAVHPSAVVTPGVVVYRLDDRLFFANASYFKARVHEAIAGAATPTQWVVFDTEGVTGIDASGVEALRQLVDSLAADGITLVLARVKSPLHERLRATGLAERIRPERIYPTVRAAVDACVAATS